MVLLLPHQHHAAQTFQQVSIVIRVFTNTYILIATIASVNGEEQDGHQNQNHSCCNGHNCCIAAN